MESTFTIKLNELNIDFIQSIKKLFKKDREIQITISSAEDFGLNEPETKDAYFARIQTSINNLNKKQHSTQLSIGELDEMALKHFSK